MDSLIAYRDDLGLTFPILVDESGAVHDAYSQQTAFGGTIYPQDWIIGSDGRVAYIHNGYDPEAMHAILEAELSD